jgi:hypothetical protein
MRLTRPSLITNLEAHHHSVSHRTSPMSDHRVLTGSAVSETSLHPPTSDSQSVLPRRARGADIPEPDLANIADILLRVALGIIVFPTDRLDTSDPAAVREDAARYLVRSSAKPVT